MKRLLPLSFALPLLLYSGFVRADYETFPVVHNDAITVRILGGKDAQPLAHLHLILIGGYEERDLHMEMWREELLTDSNGDASLPAGLANLPFLEVRVAKKHLCMDGHQAAFSVERIRRDGFSAPNHCGIAMVRDVPGVLNVFAKSSAAPLPKRSALCAATVTAKVIHSFTFGAASSPGPAGVFSGAAPLAVTKPVLVPAPAPGPAEAPVPPATPALSPPRSWLGLRALLPPLGVLR